MRIQDWKPWANELKSRAAHVDRLSQLGATTPYYEHGWPYCCQYMRHGGFMFQTAEGMGFLASKVGARSEPGIVAWFGPSEPVQWAELAAVIGERVGDALLLLDVAQQEAKQLLREPQFDSVDDPNASLEETPEATYPQVSVDLQALMPLKAGHLGDRALLALGAPLLICPGGRGKSFRESVLRALRAASTARATLRKWQHGDLGSALSCARENAAWHIERAKSQGHRVRGGVQAVYEPTAEVLTSCSRDLRGVVLEQHGKIEAFALWDELSKHIAGIYAMASRPRPVGGMDLTLSAAFGAMASSGYSLAHLGGSEIETLHYFKAKVGAIVSRSVCAIRYTPLKSFGCG